jgi:uncharacterized membrane protein
VWRWLWLYSQTVSVQTADAETYHLTILEGGGIALGVNDKGQVVGAVSSGGSEQAVIWNGTTPTVLSSPAGTTGVAYGINNAGQVVGTVCPAAACAQDGTTNQAVVWDSKRPDAAPTFLNSLGGTSEAKSINNSGQVAGAAPVRGVVGNQAVVWDSKRPDAAPTVLNSLGTPSVFGKEAVSINNSGQVAGAIGTQAVVWDSKRPDAAPTVLSSPAGTFGSSTVGISDSGLIAGNLSVSSTAGLFAPVIWNGTTPTVLDTYGFSSNATGINNAGQVVGWGFFGSRQVAIVWNGITPTNLNTLLDESSLDLDFILQVAFAINSNGDIVGYGNNGSHTEAFLLTPVRETPLPAALPLFATGLAGLGLLGWRRKKTAAG